MNNPQNPSESVVQIGKIIISIIPTSRTFLYIFVPIRNTPFSSDSQFCALFRTFSCTNGRQTLHEARASATVNQIEAVEAPLTFETNAMNPNPNHNQLPSQPPMNANWHPAILPPINVDPLPFQPFDQQAFQPFDQQPLPLDPGRTFQFMFQPPENDYWPRQSKGY